MKTVVITIIVSVLMVPLSAQWLTQPTTGVPRTADGKPNLAAPTPRTSDGKPDFSGMWRTTTRTVTAGLKPVATSVDALVRQRAEDLDKDSMIALCLPLGPRYITTPGADPSINGMMKVVQTPALIVILNPDLTYRQIFLDGRSLETTPNPTWMGYSVGKWEGDTLVVESNGFNDRTWLDGNYPHTEGLRTLERYRRNDFGHLELDVSFEDPTLYAAPFRTRVSAELVADTELLEYVCNENPRREHWVGKLSDAERSEIKLDRATLEKYTGTYIEQKPFWARAPSPRIFEITSADGALYVEQKGESATRTGKTRLIAQTETLFDNRGLVLEFAKEGQSAATHLFDKHVSGDYRFDRTK